MSTRTEAAGVGTGGLIKSNQTSSDNTLAFPVGPGTITYKKPNRPQALTTTNNKKNDATINSSTGSTQVAGGGAILKTNNTSAENPLLQTNGSFVRLFIYLFYFIFFYLSIQFLFIYFFLTFRFRFVRESNVRWSVVEQSNQQQQ